MNERDIQDMLTTLMENLIDAKDEVEGDDDNTTLAEIARDMVDTFQLTRRALAYAEASPTSGLVLRMDDGSEFQITIVQSRHPA